MSDTPKYSPVELERRHQERLENERRQKAKEEARRRAEAEERRRRMEAARLRAEWDQQRRKAEEDIGLLTAHIEGLHADPVLERWHAKGVAALAARVTEAKEDTTKERFARPAEILAEVRQVSERLIAEANAAQLKADQRDYIASSIVETLKAMNFFVTPVAPEHANHPATAMLIHAVTSANQSVHVSVPVEGQLMYTVDGYPMTTEAVTGGGRAGVCDQAKAVLDDMQSRLQEAFGVRTGEIWWESKNPNRTIGGATELPKSTDASRNLKA
jgi:hypothetical protein